MYWISGPRRVFGHVRFVRLGMVSSGVRRPVQRGAVMARYRLVMVINVGRIVPHVEARVSSMRKASSRTGIGGPHAARVIPTLMRTKRSPTTARMSSSSSAHMSAPATGVICERGRKRQTGHTRSCHNGSESSNPARRADSPSRRQHFHKQPFEKLKLRHPQYRPRRPKIQCADTIIDVRKDEKFWRAIKIGSVDA